MIPRRRVFAAIGIGCITLLLLELGVTAGVEFDLLDTPRPQRGGTGFWKGHHPELGVWHEPNAETVHQKRCFKATYSTNSVGARDVERSPAAARPRAVVLGDSFLEGWGLPAAERLSNLLEESTGVEHLNFAMSHFGPYQQLIAYRTLAQRFDHEGVIASVVPHNDFVDITFERARYKANYTYRYRPYLVEESSGFVHLDYREPLLRRVLRRYSYAFNAALHAERTLRGETHRRRAPASDLVRRIPSNFYDFSEAEYRVLETILVRLAEETRGKRLAVLLIPTLNDLRRFRRDGRDQLSPRLAALGEREGFALVNLLPEMAADRASWADYFHRCDFHWSAYGNRVALRIALRSLDGEFYRALAPSGTVPPTSTRPPLPTPPH
jgi:hypothetical protein